MKRGRQETDSQQNNRCSVVKIENTTNTNTSTHDNSKSHLIDGAACDESKTNDSAEVHFYQTTQIEKIKTGNITTAEELKQQSYLVSLLSATNRPRILPMLVDMYVVFDYVRIGMRM
jgi:hypothetical protein